MFRSNFLLCSSNNSNNSQFREKKHSCFCLLKRQQLVPVIFVLLLSCLDFGRQSNVQVGADGIKVIEDIDYPILYF